MTEVIASSGLEKPRGSRGRQGAPRPAAPRPRETPQGQLGFLLGLWRNPLTTWTRRSFEESVIQSESLLGSVTVVSDPSAIRHVLVDNVANYRKDALQLRILRPGLGDGVFTAEGEDWRMQRRALAPLFTPRAVGEFLPAMAQSRFASGFFDEDTTHRLRRRAQKVLAPPPFLPIGIVQAQPRFVDERCRLKRLPGPLLSHFVRRQPAQFPINQREQLVGSFRIACVNGTEQLGNVGHRNETKASRWKGRASEFCPLNSRNNNPEANYPPSAEW